MKGQSLSYDSISWTQQPNNPSVGGRLASVYLFGKCLRDADRDRREGEQEQACNECAVMSQGGKGDWGKEMSSWRSRWRERVYLCVQDRKNDRFQKSQIAEGVRELDIRGNEQSCKREKIVRGGRGRVPGERIDWHMGQGHSC